MTKSDATTTATVSSRYITVVKDEYYALMRRIDQLEAENAALRKRVEGLKAVLEMVEFVPTDDELECPWCEDYRQTLGHTPDCPRQKALGLSTSCSEGAGGSVYTFGGKDTETR